MDQNNITFICLLGLETPQNITLLMFFLLLFIYCATICGNLLIITLVSSSKTLQTPMYFFISQMSLSDILLVTDVLPSMLQTILVKERKLLFSVCITQFYFLAVALTAECLLLTAMSYDRYLAICKPLRYSSIMTNGLCWLLVTLCWVLSRSVVLIHIFTMSKLQFCGANIIDHFFCDLEPILKLSCSDTSIVQLEATITTVVFCFTPVIMIITSYVYIIITIFEIQSITSRQKVFSTCSSHLTVVSMYYGTLACVYLVPNREQSLNISKFLSLLYTVVTPLMNPIVYSLRNKDFKDLFRKKA